MMKKEISDDKGIKGERKESRKRTFEKIEELKKTTLEAIKKGRKDDDKKCWFDLQKCPSGFEVKDFEDIRGQCGNCSQLPIEKFFGIVEYIFGSCKFIEDKENKAREEGREEGRAGAKEEAEQEKEIEAANIYDEISEEIDQFFPEIETAIKEKI